MTQASRAHLLLVERHRKTHDSFVEVLKKRYDVTSVNSGKQAAVTGLQSPASIIVLDSVSMNSPGDRTARQIKKDLPSVPLLHVRSEKGESNADMVLVAPVTPRKLTNAIERLLKSPAEQDDHKSDIVLRHSSLSLNVTRRILTANGQETTLNPKLAALVEYFFRHPGETLERKQLMAQIWQTDYLGDTRTLDVHIRWIRRVIEIDPAKPQYLKTARGVGYRFEVPK
jgi:DNA-binding response OmpR family regulator